MKKIAILGDVISHNMPEGLIEGDVTLFGSKKASIQDMFKILKNKNLSKYDTIVLQCGINDFILPNKINNPEETAYYMMELIRAIKTQYPGKEFIVETIYPNVAGYKKIPALRGRSRHVNNCIGGLCVFYEGRVKFLDTQNILGDAKGSYKEGLSNNGLTPSEEGYKLVAKELNKMINENDSENER